MPPTLVPSPSKLSTMDQLFHSSDKAASAKLDSKYLFSVATVNVTGYSSKRQMLGVVMSEHLGAEVAALKDHPRVKEIPAVRALLGALHRETRRSFPATEESETPETPAATEDAEGAD